MRLTQVKISGLFGIFDHTVDLKTHERITIIHGPNGFGKTTLLKFLFSLFSRQFQLIRSIPFGSCSLTFDDDSLLFVERRPQELFETGVISKKLQPTLHFQYRKQADFFDFDFYPVESGREWNHLVHVIEASVEHLRRVSPREWRDFHTNEILTSREVVDRYADRIPPHMREILPEPPSWLTQVLGSIPVHLIETQRLHVHGKGTRQEAGKDDRPNSVVTTCSDDLVQRIRKILTDSVTFSQSLDRTFPTRVLDRTIVPSSYSEYDIRHQYTEILLKRERLAAIGLISPGPEEQVALPERELDETEHRVLWLYMRDSKRKLGEYDDLLRRTELLVRIINSHFQFKQLSISRDQGFQFTLHDGAALPLRALSSGEQHELVLLYQLLFHTPPNSLVLIDEPELSLHLSWQQRFLSNLYDLSAIVKSDFLLATHSPQIIHDRWDLTVELTGPNHAKLSG